MALSGAASKPHNDSPAIGLEELFQLLPAALIAFDAHTGSIWLANRRAEQILERGEGELEGCSIETVFAPIPWMRASVGQPGPDRQRTVDLPSGKRLLAGFTLVDLPSEHGADYLLQFQDIGAWVRLREERNRLMQVATVGSALPALLHELKNPLASVTTTVEVLVEEVEPGHVQQQLHAVLSELRRLRLSIDGVGAVGQGLRTLRHAPIDLACREAWSIMEARAARVGVRCRAKVADMPLLALDPSVVRAIVYNLLQNAIQACSHEDTVNLYADLVDGGRSLELVVVDDGPGMTAEVLEHCTELFFTTRRTGSGIGLALVRGAVEEAGGQLRIESVPGFGTCVTVVVPVTPLAEEPT